MHIRLSSLFCCLLLLGAPAKVSEVTFPTAPLDIQTQGSMLHFTVEVANSDEQHQRGLMFRKRLAPMHGMIFIFPEVRPVSFWMKNTEIPLDMLFVDGTGTITGITRNATPESIVPIPSSGPVKAVIELAGGSADKYHIALEDHVIYSVFP